MVDIQIKAKGYAHSKLDFGQPFQTTPHERIRSEGDSIMGPFACKTGSNCRVFL